MLRGFRWIQQGINVKLRPARLEREHLVQDEGLREARVALQQVGHTQRLVPSRRLRLQIPLPGGFGRAHAGILDAGE
jgi:hypothetical protein